MLENTFLVPLTVVLTYLLVTLMPDLTKETISFIEACTDLPKSETALPIALTLFKNS